MRGDKAIEAHDQLCSNQDTASRHTDMDLVTLDGRVDAGSSGRFSSAAERVACIKGIFDALVRQCPRPDRCTSDRAQAA